MSCKDLKFGAWPFAEVQWSLPEIFHAERQKSILYLERVHKFQHSIIMPANRDKKRETSLRFYNTIQAYFKLFLQCL